MIRGSCLCGGVRFELADAPQFINHCHCSMCRKAHGAAFGSFLHSDASGFRWTAGEEQVANYPSSPDNVRAFCTVCGSRLPVLEDEGTHVIIPAGILDDDPGVRPVVHIHAASKAPWYEIEDGLPRFDEFPPDAFWTAFESGRGDAPAGEAPFASADAGIALLEAFAAAFNRHDADALMSMMTTDCVFESSAGPEVCGTRYVGAEAVRAAFVQVWTAFPDAHWGDARHFVAGDRGVSHWTFTGTGGDGSRVAVHGCDLFTFRAGRIALKDSYRKQRPPLPGARG